MRPKPNSKNPELSKAAADVGSDDGVYWPGEGMRKAGEVIQGKNGEVTRIPTILNSGKKYDGVSRS